MIIIKINEKDSSPFHRMEQIKADKNITERDFGTKKTEK